MTLSELWTEGFSSVGDVTAKSAAYVANYTNSKLSSAVLKLNGFKPEFSQGSNRPGIGKSWFDKYYTDWYPDDEVVVAGFKQKPPKYYDKLLERINPEMFASVKASRIEKALQCRHNSSYDRLQVRKKCAIAKSSLFKRGSADPEYAEA